MKKFLLLLVLATISTSVFATKIVEEPKEDTITIEEVVDVEEIIKN